jgi:hypothetical protein
MNQLSDDFGLCIKSGNLDDAKLLLIKMKYLMSIENSLKEKIQKT